MIKAFSLQLFCHKSQVGEGLNSKQNQGPYIYAAQETEVLILKYSSQDSVSIFLEFY